MNSDQVGRTPVVKVKVAEKAPYVIDYSKLHRFNSRNTILGRVEWDTSWEGYRQRYKEKLPSILTEGKPGYSRIDYALAYASWILRYSLEPRFTETKKKPYGSFTGFSIAKEKYRIDDPYSMSIHVKQAAIFLGASLVGICRLNRYWLYEDVEIPDGFENVIVMLIEMDADAINTSPALPAHAATGLGYSKMAFLLACMGEFIRNLGYGAIECGNDTALSIPLAIDAGLGELGRNGLLITPQYGPRVRICKIITDLPLKPDKPIEFGVREFCRKCKLCAKYCEAQAISMSDEPSFEIACQSNNPGVLKWYVDVERCYLYWCRNNVSCSTCIKVCPYNTITAKRK